MKHLLVVLAVFGALALGGLAWTSAQEGQSGTSTNELGTPCAIFEASPVASPEAGLMASPEAGLMASPEASPATLVVPGCVTDMATPGTS